MSRATAAELRSEAIVIDAVCPLASRLLRNTVLWTALQRHHCPQDLHTSGRIATARALAGMYAALIGDGPSGQRILPTERVRIATELPHQNPQVTLTHAVEVSVVKAPFGSYSDRVRMRTPGRRRADRSAAVAGLRG